MEFSKLHPVLQLQRLNNLYWEAVEGYGNKAMQEFNKCRTLVSKDLLTYISQTNIDPYLVAHFVMFLPGKVFPTADKCLIEGIQKRIDEIKSVMKHGTSDWVVRENEEIHQLEIIKSIVEES